MPAWTRSSTSDARRQSLRESTRHRLDDLAVAFDDLIPQRGRTATAVPAQQVLGQLVSARRITAGSRITARRPLMPLLLLPSARRGPRACRSAPFTFLLTMWRPRVADTRRVVRCRRACAAAAAPTRSTSRVHTRVLLVRRHYGDHNTMMLTISRPQRGARSTSRATCRSRLVRAHHRPRASTNV